MAVLTAGARILTVNAGTSSLKLRVLGPDDRVVASSDLPPVGTTEAAAGLKRMARESDALIAVGHRLVHGGAELRESAVVTDGVLTRLRAAAELAPLHLPPALDALEGARRLLPAVPHVACFDTAFHAHMPATATTYAVPWEWTERWGIRRYGFHGLSHAYVSRRAAELVRRPLDELRIVSCHLGAGASLAAVRGGRSVDTTMGFTPLEGLVMATRSGSVDPGALLWLQRRASLGADSMEEALSRRSGLLGLSGVSADMREVLAAADRGEERAALAIGVYLHRLRQGIAAMAASLGGVDVIAFAGGVGEGSAAIRRAACHALGFLGVSLDDERNERPADDADVATRASRVRVLVVHTREDIEIAREARRLVAGEPSPRGGGV